MANKFEVENRWGDALTAAHAIRGFLSEKVGEAEILRKESDRPLVRSGATEVVVSGEGDTLEVTFTGTNIGEDEIRLALEKPSSTSARSQQSEGGSFEFGESRDKPRFDIVTFKNQTAIVRSGEATRGEVQAEMMELPDALERVRQEAGLDGDDLVTVFRQDRHSAMNVNPLVHPDEIAEGLVIAAVETPGMAQAILGIKDDDPNQTFSEVGGPENRDFVVKPFTQQQAKYRQRGDPQFSESHPKCKDCAHFDGHGNCLIVPNIEPDEYCEEFFADVGVFGVEVGAIPDVNLTVFGEDFDWSRGKIENFMDRVKESLIGER